MCAHLERHKKRGGTGIETHDGHLDNDTPKDDPRNQSELERDATEGKGVHFITDR